MTVAIVGILGARVGTVTGVLLTRTLEQRDENRRWVRSATTQAYGAYIDELQRVRMDVRKLVHDTSDGPDRAALDRAHVDLWTAYNAAFVAVELYGAPAVYGRALVADTALRTLSHDARQRVFPATEWHDRRLAVDEAMRATIDQIRLELRLPEQASRGAWVNQRSSVR